MTGPTKIDISFATPDLGPIQRITAEEVANATHALSRFRSVLINGKLECPIGTDILEEDETLIASYGDENVSVYVIQDEDVIFAIGHAHGTEHLVIDGDLLEALGIIGASPDPRITVLRVVDFATTVFERGSNGGREPPTVPDGIQYASDLAGALDRPAAISIVNAVGADPGNPILPGTSDGAAGGETAETFARTPFTCVRIEGGQFGHEMVIDRLAHTIQPTPMDTVARMRIIAEARAKRSDA